jgi:hypothetical protein
MKCIQCGEPAPEGHDRWASVAGEQDDEFWQGKRAKLKAEAIAAGATEETLKAGVWGCPRCKIGNFASADECFRCGEYRCPPLNGNFVR